MMASFRLDLLQSVFKGSFMKQIFSVSGMTCGHCVRAVTQAIQQLAPQAEVEVDLISGRVEVQSHEPRDALAQAIVDEGYAVAA